MEEVELLPAYFWKCPDCDCDNFERADISDMSDALTQEEIELLRETLRLEESEGIFLDMPEYVTCTFCQEKFETKNPLEDDDE